MEDGATGAHSLHAPLPVIQDQMALTSETVSAIIQLRYITENHVLVPSMIHSHAETFLAVQLVGLNYFIMHRQVKGFIIY